MDGFLADPRTWQAFLRGLYALNFVVYAKEPFGGPEQVLKYLAQYTHRAAISNGRLVGMHDGKVTFTWKDYANGCQRKQMSLAGLEFLRRFALHILPKGLVRIRQYGLLANRDRSERITQVRALLGQSPAQTQLWLSKAVELKPVQPPPLVCPHCGRQTLVLVGQVARPRKPSISDSS